MGCPTSITIRSPGDPGPNPGGSQGGPGSQGPQGYQGYQGNTGQPGVGSQGPQGNSGVGGTGPQGFQGVPGSGGSGGGTYTNSTPTPTTIGGIAAGSTFNAQTLQQMFDSLLYPYQSPAFSSFAINGQATVVEVGTSISGSQTFSWGISNSSNLQSGSLIIKDATSNTTLGSGLPNTGSYSTTLSAVQKTSQASNTWNITGTNTQSANFSANFTVNWYWKFYYGVSANVVLSENDIEALASNILTSGYARTYSYPGGGYKYLCYPTSSPAAVSFKDSSNNLNVAMADSSDNSAYSNTANGLSYALVSVTNTLSQTITYRVYRTKNVLGGSINIVVA